MQRTGNPNVNTKFYWDSTYEDVVKREEYQVDSTELEHPVVVNNAFIYPTKRFSTAVAMVREGDKTIDIGCGTGGFVKRVLEKYPHNEAWGVDISSTVIEQNKKTHPDGTFFQQYIGAMDKVPDDYFDVAFSGEVIEHLEEPYLLFQDAFRCLKVGGKFIITTPNERQVLSKEHIWYVSKDDVQKLYEDAGFTNVEFIDLKDLEKKIVIVAVGEKCQRK